VLVSEGLSLAIAQYLASRRGRRFQTLLRDETDSALKEDLAPAYIRMLRKAGQIMECRHVIFISHNPRCIELADAVLEVKDGKVEVR
jgi:DNA repair exonuclease SbcCD ATPase subunit